MLRTNERTTQAEKIGRAYAAAFMMPDNLTPADRRRDVREGLAGLGMNVAERRAFYRGLRLVCRAA